jgi:hypothetical protein
VGGETSRCPSNGEGQGDVEDSLYRYLQPREGSSPGKDRLAGGDELRVSRLRIDRQLSIEYLGTAACVGEGRRAKGFGSFRLFVSRP